MANRERLLNNFGSWLGLVEAPPTSRRRFMDALRRSLEIELPKRDNQFEVVARDLTGTERLTCEYDAGELRVFPVKEEGLGVAVVCPNWSRGWRHISKDDMVEDYIATFFFLARQYVLRSRQASVLGALALTHQVAADFRGAWLTSKVFTRVDVGPSDAIALVIHDHLRDADAGRGRVRRLSRWITDINGLDPYVHRAVFQCVRARKLLDAGFEEEFITALDGLASVASQFAVTRMGAPSHTRAELASLLRLTRGDSKTLKSLYELRCDFGAHPGESNWWDFAETYEDVFPKFIDVGERILNRIISLEHTHRIIEPWPRSWSEWFNEHGNYVYEAVWSHKIRPF